MTGKSLHILLTDDSRNEHIFFTHALRSMHRPVIFNALPGGVELLEYLRDPSNALPDILFLDINMPLCNGKECLSEIRSDSRLDGMPVVMYSTSDASNDVDDTYGIGANLYVRKPTGMEDLRVILQSVLSLYESNGLRRPPREQYLHKGLIQS